MNLDRDGDGTISIAELDKTLRSMQTRLKASDDEIEKAIKSIDKDGDGTVNLAEFLTNQKDKTKHDLIHRALVHRSKIRKEFEKFDKDNSGFVTEDEILQVMQARGAKITADDLKEMLKKSDENDDGKIDYEEFVMLMTK